MAADFTGHVDRLMTKARATPLALTNDELETIESFDTAFADDARDRIRQAQLEMVQKHVAPSHPPDGAVLRLRAFLTNDDELERAVAPAVVAERQRLEAQLRVCVSAMALDPSAGEAMAAEALPWLQAKVTELVADYKRELIALTRAAR